MRPILVMVGPTAAGKTELALEWAQRLGAEIVSADSRQIYQGINLGTGKPTADQLRQVKHHLVSLVSPGNMVTADHYARMALEKIESIATRGKLPFVVGGTGLWIKALVDGLPQTPPPDPDLRSVLRHKAETEGTGALYAELQAVDPHTASRLNPGDRLRIIRALEIFHSSGRPWSAWLSEVPPRPPLKACWIGVTRPRPDLYRRAEERIDAWLAAGWLEEIHRLLEAGLTLETPALQALGIKHLAAQLQGRLEAAQAVEWIKRDTRRYIKRQLTWFRADQRIAWVDVSQPRPDVDTQIQEILTSCGIPPAPSSD